MYITKNFNHSDLCRLLTLNMIKNLNRASQAIKKNKMEKFQIIMAVYRKQKAQLHKARLIYLKSE